MDLYIFIILVIVGYTAGTIAERTHYRSIREREIKFMYLPAVSCKNIIDENRQITSAELVTGSVVISIDYFKRILAHLRNIFGGEVASYESLIDRARREAILRMKEMCPEADIILNLRIETSTIGGTDRKKSIGSIETLAYGTAILYQKQHEIYT